MAGHRTRRLARLLSAGVLALGATIALPGTAQAAGTWHTATAVPGLATLTGGNPSNFGSISCASAGNCSAGGGYTDPHGDQQAFVVDQVSGTWHNAHEVPGTATLNDTLAATSSNGTNTSGATFATAEARRWAVMLSPHQVIAKDDAPMSQPSSRSRPHSRRSRRTPGEAISPTANPTSAAGRSTSHTS